MLFNLLQAAVDTTAIAQTATVPQEMKLSLIDMATKGGWLMIVLLLLSVIAIYIFGNKWWMIRKAGQIDRNFMKDIHDYIHDGWTRTKGSSEIDDGVFDNILSNFVEYTK